MKKLIRDFKGSAFNSRWGRVGLVLGVLLSLYSHVGVVIVTAGIIVALGIAAFLDWKYPIER